MNQSEHPLTDTRAEARKTALRRAEQLRAKAYQYIYARGSRGATADEVAARLGESVLSIRPRITELFKKARIIFDSSRRRPNHSGRSARVLVSAQYKLPDGSAGGKKEGAGRERPRRDSGPSKISPLAGGGGY